jgi:hypothetical protein
MMKRPRARMVLTGVLFLIVAFLLLFVHLGIVVVAAALMAVVGISSLQAARRADVWWCPSCRKRF